jgi:uncharacterized iron-regulated protein
VHILLLLIAATALVVSPAGAAPPSSPAPRLLVFGERHDQPDQQRQVADQVRELADARKLAAVVLEMAEAPHTTRGLLRDADAAEARSALGWRGWPWDAYAAVVMNAVRAGVPVLGCNLPRDEMRGAMAAASLDDRVDADTRAALTQALRSGHCQLLPAAQEPGMVRIQIARDRSMAGVASAALRDAAPGQTVLLLTGAMHASRDHGVPRHLPEAGGDDASTLQVVMFGAAAGGLRADEWRAADVVPQPDPCVALRARLAAPAPASAASR